MKKVLIILALFLFPFLSSAPVEAKYLDLIGTDPDGTFKQGLEAEGMNYPQFGTYALQNTFQGLTKFLVDYPPLEGQQSNLGAMGAFSTAIAALYTNQPSTVDYIAYNAQKFNLIKPTYAANGEGWNFLSPLLKIWTISRNAAYVFFVVIFVVAGFLIMFRTKINPQTTIGIQLALPRIIVALILVTFSYALSGLLVDVVFLGHGLIKNVITEPGPNSCNTTTGTSNSLVFNDEYTTWEQNCDNGLETPSVWPFDIMAKYGTSEGSEGITGQLLQGIGAVFTSLWDKNVTFTSALFNLIIAASVVGATFKIFFALLTKYVMIVFNVISMPFAFLLTAVSGQANPVKPFKELLANTISFPITSLLLAIAYYFSSQATVVYDLPPLYMEYITGQAAATGSKVINNMVAIGILMAIPTILASIDQAFEAKPLAQGASEQIANMMRKLPIIGGMMG